MAQLFLYLTFVVVSTIGVGEVVDISTESAIERGISCAEQDSTDKNADSDDSDDGSFTTASLNIPNPVNTDSSHFISVFTHPTVGQFSIRAPPILLS